MFEIGDYVLNATNGICKIKEIVELDMSGDKNPKSYFLLRPIDEENDKVYIPVDNADKRIRKVINKEEAVSIIEMIRKWKNYLYLMKRKGRLNIRLQSEAVSRDR